MSSLTMFMSLIKRLVLLGIGVSGTLSYTFGTAVQYPQLRATDETSLMTRNSLFFRPQPYDGIIIAR